MAKVVPPILAQSRSFLPKSVRATLGVRPGESVDYLIHDGEVTLRKSAAAHSASPAANRITVIAFDDWYKNC